MPTTPALADTAARTVDEQFLGLMCSDEDLLRAEFDAIIAAEWPSPPPTTTPRRGAAHRHPGQPHPPPRRRSRRPSSAQTAAPRHRRMGPATLTPAVVATNPRQERQVIATRESAFTR